MKMRGGGGWIGKNKKKGENEERGKTVTKTNVQYKKRETKLLKEQKRINYSIYLILKSMQKYEKCLITKNSTQNAQREAKIQRERKIRAKERGKKTKKEKKTDKSTKDREWR
jgi:hypothetical protein